MKLIEVTEGRGKQVLDFANYVARLGEVAPGLKDSYKKIGSDLFKEGFKYEDTLFVLIPDRGGLWEVHFPAWSDIEAVKNGRFYLHHYRFVKGKKYEYGKHMSVNEVLLWTVPTLLQHMETAARSR